MKHWLPPASVLAGILAFCLWDSIHMQQETLHWCAQLQRADQLAVADNWDGALELLERSYQDWLSRQMYIHTVAPRDAADDAEAMYHRAIAFAKTEEITEFRAELSDLQDQMRVLKDMESFSFHTIF